MSTTVTPISTDLFNSALADNTRRVHELIAQSPDTSVMPMLLIKQWALAADGPALSDGVMILSNFVMDQRYHLLEATGRQLLREGYSILALWFVSEAWISIQEPGAQRRYARPSQDPDRQEIVSIAGQTIDGRFNMGRIDVTRDADNLIVPGAITLYPYSKEGSERMENELTRAFFQGYAQEAATWLSQRKLRKSH